MGKAEAAADVGVGARLPPGPLKEDALAATASVPTSVIDDEASKRKAQDELRRAALDARLARLEGESKAKSDDAAQKQAEEEEKRRTAKEARLRQLEEQQKKAKAQRKAEDEAKTQAEEEEKRRTAK